MPAPQRRMGELHRRLGALLSLLALVAFVSGAGLDAPSVLPAGVILVLAVFTFPGERFARALEPFWRGGALLLALRAGYQVLRGGGDPVLPMVDLLLLLLCAESLRPRDSSGDARHFALTFALLIASAAYRPGALFGITFVLYVVCATVLLVVGHLHRQARVHGLQAAAPRRQFLARIALLSSVVLVVSAGVFLFFPRVSQGWAARATPTISRAVVGFSDRVSLGEHGATIAGNPAVVLRVEFPEGVPPNPESLHWRGRSYNRFDGTTWSRTNRSEGAPLEHRWPGPTLEQLVYGRPLGDAPVLFGLHPVISMAAQSRIRPFRLGSGDYLYLGESDPVYRVTSRLARPSPAELRTVRIDSADTRDADAAAVVMQNLQLPRITGRMLALADSFSDASPTMYDHVVAVEHWLRTQFAYTLELPATRRETGLDHFLFERRAGHCEYFSTAMAILLRAGGVPTRNVNGFLGGQWNEFGGFLTVTQNQAHSWVEVYFPGYGWVEFDPTPAGGTAGLAARSTRFLGVRQFLAGIEHRWGKWILDYDVVTQTALVQRATAPFTERSDAGRTSDDSRRFALWPVLAAAALVLGLFLTARRLRLQRRQPQLEDTRSYLRLRAAYERAGYPSAQRVPPLRFATALEGAPGAAHARRAVELYVQARFGGRMLSADERSQLVASVTAAREELRRSSTKAAARRTQ